MADEILTYKPWTSEAESNDFPGMSLLNQNGSMPGSYRSTSSNRSDSVSNSGNQPGASILSADQKSIRGSMTSVGNDNHLPGASCLGINDRSYSSSSDNKPATGTCSLGRTAASEVPGSSTLQSASSRTRSLGSVDQNQGGPSMDQPGTSMMLDRSLSSDAKSRISMDSCAGGRSLQPGTSTCGLDQSMSSVAQSRGSGDIVPGSSTMDLNRSLSNQSSSSINYHPGSSMMDLNGQNLSRSFSTRSGQPACLPGSECLPINAQTLRLGKPVLEPGISIIESSECKSAPVQTKPFDFDHSRTSSAHLAGASLMDINGASTNSLAPESHDNRPPVLQPGISMLPEPDRGSSSKLSTSPSDDCFQTALMGFSEAETSGSQRPQQQKKEGEKTQVPVSSVPAPREKEATVQRREVARRLREKCTIV